MINAPGLTSRGKRITAFIAVIIAFLLPKDVECRYPGGECGRHGMFRQICKDHELEPLGFFLIEKLVQRDVGFAYRATEECH
ncbi:MAG: hypothetical protein ABI175_02750 [Polyangiales bacterium]